MGGGGESWVACGVAGWGRGGGGHAAAALAMAVWVCSGTVTGCVLVLAGRRLVIRVGRVGSGGPLSARSYQSPTAPSVASGGAGGGLVAVAV